jgi:hypothetical protein
MRRDMDLVRQVLLAVEANPSSTAPCQLNVNGYSEEQLAYHTCLLHQAGLIEGIEEKNHYGPEVAPVRLTWAGHEFLEAARELARWSEAKRLIGKLGGASLALWRKVLEQLLLKALGLA